MKYDWKRHVSMVLCLMFIFSAVPTIAEDITEAEVPANVELEEQTFVESENTTPVPDTTSLPEPENTELPTETPNVSETSEPETSASPETSEFPIEDDVVDLPIIEEETETEAPSFESTNDDAQIDGDDLHETNTNIIDFYALQDAILPVSDFLIEGNKLIAYQGSDSEIITPNDVTIIGASAFANHENISSITISDSVTCIEENAFRACKSLAFLHIPSSVTEIAELDSLIFANPQVHIEVASGSYAEGFCQAHSIAYICFDIEKTEILQPTTIVPAAEKITIGIQEKVSIAGWTLLPAGAQDSMTYAVQSSKIASVNADGIITGKRTGSTKIYLTSGTGLTATIQLTVMKSPTSISLSVNHKELGQGETAKLSYTLSKKSAGAVTFESLNPEIATVDADGVITALALGRATIRATTYNKKSKTIDLNIGTAPSEIIPNQTEIRIGAQDSWTLGYRLNEGAAGSVIFASSDETIATVNSDGKINALAQGKTEITITAYNGVSCVCNLLVTPEPTAFELKAERTTLGINEKLQLVPSIQPEGTMGTIQYKSSKTKTATVSGDGVVTAKRAGTVTITASTYNGLSATLKLTIKRAPANVSISAPRKTLGQGETMKLGYALSKNSAGVVIFESLNPEVATIRTDGLLTALKTGTATICAKTFNGKTAKLDVNVVAAPESVIPTQTDVCIGCGDHWKLGYSFNNGASGSVFFTSLDESIATVDENGTIYAQSKGNTQIQLTTHNGISALCNLTVVAAPSAIKIIAEKTELGIQESLKLKADISPEGTVGTLNWKSSKTRVASVNEEGVVTTKRAGTTYITVSTYNGIQSSIMLTVKKAPSSVNIQMPRTILGVGESMQLGYTLSKGSTGTVAFESLNPAVLEVTPRGEVRALASGTALIRATTHNGKKCTASIEVKNAPESLYLSENIRTLGIGENYKLSYRLNDASAGAVSFESSDPTIAGVDSNGNIKAYALGTVEIQVKTYNGIGDTCTLKIVSAPSSIDLSMLRSTFGVKEVVQLTPTILPEGSTGTLKFKSSKSSVVSVSSSGLLTAKKTGGATITVSTYNGISKSFKVKVVKAATSIRISAERTYLSVGEDMIFTAKLTGTGSYTFSSSNPDVLSIDSLSGHAIALMPGHADVIVKTHNGKTDKLEVSVLQEPTGIRISPSDIVIGRGDTTTLHAEFEGDCTGAYAFESSNREIATIDENGKLKAVGQGDVVITVRAYNGVYDTANVHVSAPISEISLKELEKDDAGNYKLSMSCGESYQLELERGTYSVVGCDYLPSSNTIAVSEGGLITAQRKGVCMLTITAYSGATATVEISIDGIENTSNKASIIMHAMGAVDGKHYSNSREAFLQNYAKGNRMFEIDLQYTSDKELVLWHNWNSNQINSDVKAGYIPTEKEFADMLIFDRYDSLTYRDLLVLMDAYPDTLFFIDSKKTKATDVREQFSKMVSVARETGHIGALDRMVIMIYNQEMYSIVKAIHPFKNYVLMGYKYFSKAPSYAQVKKAMEFCVSHNISIISIWDYWWQSDFQTMAEEYGLIVSLHTIDSMADARQYVAQGVKLITSNVISEGTL